MAAASACTPLIGRTITVSSVIKPSSSNRSRSRPSSWRSPTRALKISATPSSDSMRRTYSKSSNTRTAAPSTTDTSSRPS